MAIFDAIRAKLADFGQDVANQSQMMTDSARIQEKIRAEEKELEQKYQTLGRAYYNRQSQAQAQGAPMLLEDISSFEAINSSLSKIRDLENELEKVRHGA